MNKFAVLVFALFIGNQVMADSAVSEVSQLSVEGAASIAGTGLDVIGAASELTVHSVSKTAEGTFLILKGIAESGEFLVDLSGYIVGNASVAVGAAVEVTTSAAGMVLSTAGEVLAFIPNEVGAELLHHSERS